MYTRPKGWIERARLARFSLAGITSVIAGPDREEHGKLSPLPGHVAWPLVVTFILWAAALLILRDMTVTHDVVWQMWIARQLLHGAELYGDILELNPPLWFWLGIPFQAAAEALNIPPVQAMILGFFAYIGGVLVLLSRLLRNEVPLRRAGLLLAALVAMVVVPISDFGQREHLALIGALPYVVLVALRVQGRSPGLFLAFTVGLAAAFGFALKHYFIAVPLLLELWLFFAHRKNWKLFRPEIFALCGAAAAYAIAVFLFSPAFFSTLVPMVDLAYHGYQMPLAKLLQQPWVLIWALGAIGLFRMRAAMPPIVIAAMLAFLGFALAYFVQQKGWRYHALPASACLTFAMAAAVTFWDRPWRALRRNPIVPAVGLFPIFVGLLMGPYSNPYAVAVEKALASARPGEAAMMLSVNASLMWPMVEDAKLVWPSRHFTFWMVPAIAHLEAEKATLSLKMAEMAQRIRTQTSDDLLCRPPRLILVDDTEGSAAMYKTGFDILAFFRRDPSFDALFSHYRQTGMIDRFTIYELADDWRPPRPENCRPIY